VLKRALEINEIISRKKEGKGRQGKIQNRKKLEKEHNS
jgi:hypothetical protein